MMYYTSSEGQTRSSSTYLYSTLRHFIILNGCYGCYVFVNIFKATSYATGKLVVSIYPRQMSYSIGLLYAGAFMGIELNKLTIDVTTICFTPCKSEQRFSVLQNINSSQFGEATGNIISILFLFTFVVIVITIIIRQNVLAAN